MKKKLSILITCGPTREPIDPVRFISNESTGILGLELAKQCKKEGHEVRLLHGTVAFDTRPYRGMAFSTARDLQKKIKRELFKADILMMAAAVSDYRPSKLSLQKIKRKKSKPLYLKLEANPDVLKSLESYKKNKIFVGFSVESGNVEKFAQGKMRAKSLDMIVAQKVSNAKTPFGAKPIDSWVFIKGKSPKIFKNISKTKLARFIVKESLFLFSKNNIGRSQIGHC